MKSPQKIIHQGTLYTLLLTPVNLLAQLATYLQPTPETHQHQATPAASQALTNDQLSEVLSELQQSIR